MPNKIKETIEESMRGVVEVFAKSSVLPSYMFVSQHKLLDTIVQELEEMDACDLPNIDYTQGYNQAIDDVITLIKESRE